MIGALFTRKALPRKLHPRKALPPDQPSSRGGGGERGPMSTRTAPKCLSEELTSESERTRIRRLRCVRVHQRPNNHSVRARERQLPSLRHSKANECRHTGAGPSAAMLYSAHTQGPKRGGGDGACHQATPSSFGLCGAQHRSCVFRFGLRLGFV